MFIRGSANIDDIVELQPAIDVPLLRGNEKNKKAERNQNISHGLSIRSIVNIDEHAFMMTDRREGTKEKEESAKANSRIDVFAEEESRMKPKYFSSVSAIGGIVKID